MKINYWLKSDKTHNSKWKPGSKRTSDVWSDLVSTNILFFLNINIYNTDNKRRQLLRAMNWTRPLEPVTLSSVNELWHKVSFYAEFACSFDLCMSFPPQSKSIGVELDWGWWSEIIPEGDSESVCVLWGLPVCPAMDEKAVLMNPVLAASDWHDPLRIEWDGWMERWMHGWMDRRMDNSGI